MSSYIIGFFALTTVVFVILFAVSYSGKFNKKGVTSSNCSCPSCDCPLAPACNCPVVPVTPSWSYKGCFVDAAGDGTKPRTLPIVLINGPNIQPAQCQAAGLAAGFNVIGLQNGNECRAGNTSAADYIGYNAYGTASGCGSGGGAWTNQIYMFSS
jgi:hypothetical protein